MTTEEERSGVQSEGRYVQANGIDIHYVEAGEGEPLLSITIEVIIAKFHFSAIQ